MCPLYYKIIKKFRQLKNNYVRIIDIYELNNLLNLVIKSKYQSFKFLDRLITFKIYFFIR